MKYIEGHTCSVRRKIHMNDFLGTWNMFWCVLGYCGEIEECQLRCRACIYCSSWSILDCRLYRRSKGTEEKRTLGHIRTYIYTTQKWVSQKHHVSGGSNHWHVTAWNCRKIPGSPGLQEWPSGLAICRNVWRIRTTWAVRKWEKMSMSLWCKIFTTFKHHHIIKSHYKP